MIGFANSPTLYSLRQTDRKLLWQRQLNRFRAIAARGIGATPQLPAWIDYGSEIYGLPDLEQRGCKVALDRHGAAIDPDTTERVLNVWLVGGGSGHGFKHGPALGEYVASKIVEGGELEARFTLVTKETVRQRSVY